MNTDEFRQREQQGSASILLAHFGILPECSEQMPRWKAACFNHAAYKAAVASRMLALPTLARASFVARLQLQIPNDQIARPSICRIHLRSPFRRLVARNCK